MNRPDPIWDCTYQHDRRTQRHRCRCCSKIITAGEPVVMVRRTHKATWAIHTACATKQHGTANWTWRDAMTFWGLERLRNTGWKVAESEFPRAE